MNGKSKINKGQSYMWKKIGKTMVYLLFPVMLLACASEPRRPPVLTAGDYSHVKEYAAWLIGKNMKKRDLMAVSAAIIDDQQVVWEQGFGYADRKNKRRATAATVYRAGSITKLFTAMAIMQLVEQGKFDLDAPISTYIPQLKLKSRFENKVLLTARDLMSHHSGLFSDWFHGMWTREPVPFTQVAALISGHHTALPPNFMLSYSNVGYTLLGHALVNRSGLSYQRYIGEHLLKPLGMSHSNVEQAPPSGAAGAKAYRAGKPADEFSLRDTPAGGLNTSVSDLSRFVKMVFAGGRFDGKQILSSRSLAQMMSRKNAHVSLDFDQQVGLGWFLDSKNKDIPGLIALHDGGTMNFRSMLMLSMDHKIGVIVMTNSYEGSTGEIAMELLKKAVEAKTARPVPEEKHGDETASPAVHAEDNLTGHYASLIGLFEINKRGKNYRLTIDGNHLKMRRKQGGGFTLGYKILGLFSVDLGPLGKITYFKESVAGHEVLVARLKNRRMFFASRIRPVPISAKWRSRTGRYRVVNKSGSDLRISHTRLFIEKDFLILETSVSGKEREKTRFALAPVSDNEAVVQGLGRNTGSTVYVHRHEGRETIEFSGFVLAPI